MRGYDLSNVVIGIHPADNGAHKTQERWIDFFNEQKGPMISAADLYRAGKSASDEVLHSLRNDFYESWLVSSTRISYSRNDLSGKITQHYGSKFVKPSQTDVLVIPVYRGTPNGTPLAQALQSEDGVRYLQVLFGTNDNPRTITETLEHLSGIKAEDIGLWTPGHISRENCSERAARFVIFNSRFLVDGDLRFDEGLGRSRGSQ